MKLDNVSMSANQITYMPELPSADKYTAEENTMVAVPAKEKGKFNVYTWYEGKWVYTCALNGSDFDLQELKDEDGNWTPFGVEE